MQNCSYLCQPCVWMATWSAPWKCVHPWIASWRRFLSAAGCSSPLAASLSASSLSPAWSLWLDSNRRSFKRPFRPFHLLMLPPFSLPHLPRWLGSGTCWLVGSVCWEPAAPTSWGTLDSPWPLHGSPCLWAEWFVPGCEWFLYLSSEREGPSARRSLFALTQTWTK